MNCELTSPKDKLVLTITSQKKSRYFVAKARAFLTLSNQEQPAVEAGQEGKEISTAGELGQVSASRQKPKSVLLLGNGANIQRTVAVAETLKREVPRLAQQTEIAWSTETEAASGSIESTTRRSRQPLPCIRIELWCLDEAELESEDWETKSSVQLPLPEATRAAILSFAGGQVEPL
jgi:DNA-binding protein